MPRTNGKQQSVLVRTSETFYDAGGVSAKAPHYRDDRCGLHPSLWAGDRSHFL